MSDCEARAEAMIAGPLGDLDEVARLARQLQAASRFDLLERLLTHAGRRALYHGWEHERRVELARLLRAHEHFAHARRLLQRERNERGDSESLRQQQALCTYKDHELPLARRLERALALIKEDGLLDSASSAETFGIAGAIYKRQWQVTGDRVDLERSRWYYICGFALAGDPEQAYCGINAAFVSDLLAEVAADRPDMAGNAAELREQADRIRAELVELVAEPKSVWDRATLAEALLGLGRFDEAAAQLERVASEQDERWMLQSTAMQLAELARLRGWSDHERMDAVMHALLGSEQAALRASVGKVGLALSGGGFRASLFHIGVLARLAEARVLPQVEVLSCVSGGSIVGAYYALKLRHLLESRPDREIKDEHYVGLVRELAEEFFAAVRMNLRGRLVTDPLAALEIVMTPYTRTDRVGDLLEQLLFSRLAPETDEPLRMSDLVVTPPGREYGFSLRRENWLRTAKVPMIVVNATTLNTGHCWQFTPTWMGESPAAVDETIDTARRLRRMRYVDAPEAHRDPLLARAVAASACVPGLFPPIRLANLFDGVDVRLVDGGVHDNQGVASLLEQDCDVILVSDASGQSGGRDRPGRRLIRVTSVANSILMSRVRGAQYRDLVARRHSNRLRALMIVHLRKGLPVQPRDWSGCPEPYEPDAEDFQTTRPAYGIHADVQVALAELRTDLDAFTKREAYSLMAAGYAMTGVELPANLAHAEPLRPREPWPFARALADNQKASTAGSLRAGRARFLRPIRAMRLRRVA